MTGKGCGFQPRVNLQVNEESGCKTGLQTANGVESEVPEEDVLGAWASSPQSTVCRVHEDPVQLNRKKRQRKWLPTGLGFRSEERASCP